MNDQNNDSYSTSYAGIRRKAISTTLWMGPHSKACRKRHLGTSTLCQSSLFLHDKLHGQVAQAPWINRSFPFKAWIRKIQQDSPTWNNEHLHIFAWLSHLCTSQAALHFIKNAAQGPHVALISVRLTFANLRSQGSLRRRKFIDRRKTAFSQGHQFSYIYIYSSKKWLASAMFAVRAFVSADQLTAVKSTLCSWV